MKGKVQVLWVLIMAGVLLFVTLAAAQAFTLAATLSPDPVSYSGNCPGIITFKGKITLSSATPLANPVQVKYRFKRSDGATDTKVKILTFSQPGSQAVSTTWTLGGAALPDYCGWESVEIISPQSVNSNQAPFILMCSNVQPPNLKISDIFAIPGSKCSIGFKIKNMGAAIGAAYPNCIQDALEGTACNGQNCNSIAVPVKNNIRNPGGEDSYTGYWPNWLLDFSKPFSVKLRLKRNITFPTPSSQNIGNEFSMAKILKCL
jgi:hypothetical protein